MAKATRILTTIPTAFAYLLVLLGGLADAQSPPVKPIWSIWARNVTWQACGDFNFVLSAYPGGIMFPLENQGGTATGLTYPYDLGQPITVIGWSVTQRLSDNTAIGSWVIGSGHGGDAADVFASGGGIGTNSSRGFFPPGTGIPQGGTAWINSRFDVYGACNIGTQMMDIVIYYTNP